MSRKLFRDLYTQYKNIKLHMQHTKLTTTNSIIRFSSGNLFHISEFETYTELYIIHKS